MGGYLMDMMAPRIRRRALITLVKAYRPALTLSRLCALLAFDDATQAREFLESHSAAIEPGDKIDCRKAMQALASKDTGKKLGPG